MWRARKALNRRWKNAYAAAIYLDGHSDNVYCVQFDEYAGVNPCAREFTNHPGIGKKSLQGRATGPFEYGMHTHTSALRFWGFLRRA